MDCIKRQTVVKRGKEGTETRYRCMNSQCGFHAQEVDDSICAKCPVKITFHKRPCKEKVETSPNPVTTNEMVDVTDEEVKQMIEEAGLDADALGKSEGPKEDSSLPPNYPPLTIQAWTYKEALIRWAKAGKPKRSQEEVEQLHSQFCSKCDWYDKEKSRCRGCGCKVTVGGLAVFNKLKMKTEKCPKGKF